MTYHQSISLKNIDDIHKEFAQFIFLKPTQKKKPLYFKSSFFFAKTFYIK